MCGPGKQNRIAGACGHVPGGQRGKTQRPQDFPENPGILLRDWSLSFIIKHMDTEKSPREGERLKQEAPAGEPL